MENEPKPKELGEEVDECTRLGEEKYRSQVSGSGFQEGPPIPHSEQLKPAILPCVICRRMLEVPPERQRFSWAICAGHLEDYGPEIMIAVGNGYQDGYQDGFSTHEKLAAELQASKDRLILAQRDRIGLLATMLNSAEIQRADWRRLAEFQDVNIRDLRKIVKIYRWLFGAALAVAGGMSLLLAL